MADQKVTQLTELNATPTTGDILYIVDDPAGTPTSKKITVDNLSNFVADDTQTFTNKTFDANGTGNSLSNIEVADLASAAVADASGVNTGTSTTSLITPDALAGSYAGTKAVQVVAFDYTTATATGDGAAYFVIPSSMGGMDLVAVGATVITAGTTNTTDVQIHNVTQAADMLSTKITIDSGETDSSTAATPPVIDAANDDVAAYDVIRIDVDAISTTPAQGLIVRLEFRLP